jgi:hypothetical protein
MKQKHITTAVLALTLASLGTVQAACPDPTPPPPTNPSATPVNPYEIKFQVNKITGSQLGFHAERSSDGVHFTLINSGYPNGVFNDQYQLLPGSTWYYRTRAYDACGEVSVYCATVEVTLPSGPTPDESLPGAPTKLTASVNPNSTVSLSWTPGAFNPVPDQSQVFVIEREISGSGSWKNIESLGNSSYTDGTVIAGSKYDYRVRVFNSLGWPLGEKYFGNCGPREITNCGTAFTNTVAVTIP